MDFAPLFWNQTRISTNLDFTTPGKRFGHLRLKYSDNQTALGYIPIPAGVVINGSGLTVLLIGGVHGDEFEGPVALLKFLHEVEAAEVSGRIIVLPALNAPAVHAASRVSPVDGGNLNRAFPGDPDGTPTAMIANFVEKAVMPVCNAVIDLHSGGKAAWFSPCAMALQYEDAALSELNLNLAEIFGSPYIWLMGSLNDNRSVNYAAVRNNLPNIAAELGGGGQVSPETLKIGERGIANCLKFLNVLSGEPEPRQEPATILKIDDAAQHIYTTHRGLFEPRFSPGDVVSTGDIVGFVHNLDHIETAPVKIQFPMAGVAFVRCHRGLVAQGELLATVGKVTDRPDISTN